MSPHAEQPTTNGVSSTNGTMTNGDRHHSVFLSHLTSYPLVSDSITTYRSNPYGEKSINLAFSAYSTAHRNLYAPFAAYLSRPLGLVAPYLAKADDMGDQGLSSLESRFPIVKEDTATIQEKVGQVAGTPFRVAKESREWVWKTYDEEYQAAPNLPLVKPLWAVVGVEIKGAVKVSEIIANTMEAWLHAAQKKGKQVQEKVAEQSEG